MNNINNVYFADFENKVGEGTESDRQAKARQYARINRILTLAEMCLMLVYLFLWIHFYFGDDLLRILERISLNPWWLVFSFSSIFLLGYDFLTQPLSYLGKYHFPHRFGQSNETLRGWFTDQLKTLVLMLVMGAVLLEIIYWLLRISPVFWWFWAGSSILIINILMVFIAPLILFPIFYQFKPLDESEHGELIQRLQKLAQRSGAEIEGVYVFDMSRRTKSANAALIGLGKTRRVILGDTLINQFTIDEIETILAHELGHHVHGDIPLGILLDTLLTYIGLYLSSLFLDMTVNWLGFSQVADIRSLPLFFLSMGVFGILTMPLENALSRWREYRADRYALKTTHKNKAFISAMTRLAEQNLAEIQPDPWVEALLYSHPSIQHRIEKAGWIDEVELEE